MPEQPTPALRMKCCAAPASNLIGSKTGNGYPNRMDRFNLEVKLWDLRIMEKEPRCIEGRRRVAPPGQKEGRGGPAAAHRS